MDFKDAIHQLADRIAKMKDNVQTEEAAKTAFIMPFLQLLGYDVFNPMEVIPEYTCDIGTKQGEKIDYALQKDNTPIILIEAKHFSHNLEPHEDQLLRYFHVSKARFGVLTNGIEYRFFTDLEEPNKMDTTPFLKFNLLDLKDNVIEEIKKFHKSYFDVEQIIETASQLKYMNAVKAKFNEEIKNPSQEFIRYFASQVYTKRLTDKAMTLFTDVVKKSISQVMSETVQERLRSALLREKEQEQEPAAQAQPETAEKKIITTIEETEGFMIAKAILRSKVDVNRIFGRDFVSQYSILLDDNARKTICKLYFNGNKKSIGILGNNVKEMSFEINSVDDIYKYSEQLISALESYETVTSNN